MDMTDEERSVIDSVLIDTWWNVNFALHETEKKCMTF